MKNPRHIDDIVGQILYGIEKKKEKSADKVGLAWRKAVGENYVIHTQPVRYTRGELMVIVENSTLLYQLTMEKRSIIKIFNEEYTGRQKLKNIRFRVGKTEI